MALAGCGGGAAQKHAAAAPSRTQPAVIADTSTPPGSAFCARLESAPDPAGYYGAEVAYQTTQAGDARAGRIVVDLWVNISCPQFIYLTKAA